MIKGISDLIKVKVNKNLRWLEIFIRVKPLKKHYCAVKLDFYWLWFFGEDYFVKAHNRRVLFFENINSYDDKTDGFLLMTLN